MTLCPRDKYELFNKTFFAFHNVAFYYFVKMGMLPSVYLGFCVVGEVSQ